MENSPLPCHKAKSSLFNSLPQSGTLKGLSKSKLVCRLHINKYIGNICPAKVGTYSHHSQSESLSKLNTITIILITSSNIWQEHDCMGQSNIYLNTGGAMALSSFLLEWLHQSNHKSLGILKRSAFKKDYSNL